MRLVVDGVAAAAGGGGLTRLRELALDLPRLRPEAELTFVVRPETAALVGDLAPAARVVVLPRQFRSTPARIAWEHGWLPIQLRGLRPDIVFSPFNVIPIHWAGDPLLAVMVSNVAPYSDIVRSRARKREILRNAVLKKMTDRSLVASDLVLLQSRQAGDLLSVPVRDKTVVIPQAPPRVDRGMLQRPSGESDPYVAVIADLYKFKGVEVVLRALKHLPAEKRPRLLVCGRPLERDYEASLRTLAYELGLTAWYKFVGPQRHEAVLATLHGAIACVASSRFENHSRIPVEAMAVGTPVIAADTPSNREACGSAALFYSVDDDRRLARLLSLVAEDAGERRRLVAAGDEFVKDLEGASGPVRVLEAFNDLLFGRTTGGKPIAPRGLAGQSHGQDPGA